MNKMKGAIVVNTDHCKECSLCVVAYPQKVIELAQKQVSTHGYEYAQVMSPDDCIGCAICGVVCPNGCITVYRKRVEA